MLWKNVHIAIVHLNWTLMRKVLLTAVGAIGMKQRIGCVMSNPPIPKQFRATRSCMFCENGCLFCQGEYSYPDWYTPSKSREQANHWVRQGKHPTGQALCDSIETAKCGNCRHLRINRHHDKTYYKCFKLRLTRGAASDLRIKWRGCQMWSLTRYMEHGRVTKVEVM